MPCRLMVVGNAEANLGLTPESGLMEAQPTKVMTPV
jgi:hypothetical protein